jgi:uncharacterized protein
MSLVDPDLASILVCPADHGKLNEDIAESQLICIACGRRYPVRSGIPIMLLDGSETSDD